MSQVCPEENPNGKRTNPDRRLQDLFLISILCFFLGGNF